MAVAGSGRKSPRGAAGRPGRSQPAEMETREVLSDAETADKGDTGCWSLGVPRELEEPDSRKASGRGGLQNSRIRLRRDKT